MSTTVHFYRALIALSVLMFFANLALTSRLYALVNLATIAYSLWQLDLEHQR